MYYNLGYLEMEKGRHIACMDRKVCGWNQVLQHDKSEWHAHAVAIRRQKIEDPFPSHLCSTDIETTTATL